MGLGGGTFWVISSTESIEIGHSQVTIGFTIKNKSIMYYRNSDNLISLQKQLSKTAKNSLVNVYHSLMCRQITTQANRTT